MRRGVSRGRGRRRRSNFDSFDQSGDDERSTVKKEDSFESDWSSASFYEKAADLAHSLKGSASNVGAAEVARISQEIERLTRKSTGDTVRPLLDELDTVALATRDILQREIDD